MAYEMLVGLLVKDRTRYQSYREVMAPILKKYGGGFRYDFVVAEVLKSAAPHDINRVFTIYFADRQSSEAFFSDPDYKEVKKAYFESSVQETAILAEYER